MPPAGLDSSAESEVLPAGRGPAICVPKPRGMGMAARPAAERRNDSPSTVSAIGPPTAATSVGDTRADHPSQRLDPLNQGVALVQWSRPVNAGVTAANPALNRYDKALNGSAVAKSTARSGRCSRTVSGMTRVTSPRPRSARSSVRRRSHRSQGSRRQLEDQDWQGVEQHQRGRDQGRARQEQDDERDDDVAHRIVQVRDALGHQEGGEAAIVAQKGQH